MRETPPGNDLTDLLADMVSQYQLSQDLEQDLARESAEPVPDQASSKPVIHIHQPQGSATAAEAMRETAPQSPKTDGNKDPHVKASQQQLIESEEEVRLHPFLERMAQESVRLNASDIFINTGFAPAFRIDGTLTPAPVNLLTEAEVSQMVYSSMSAAQRVRFGIELDLNYVVQTQDGVRFRANAYHEQGRVGMVLRRLTMEIATIDDLDLPQMLKELAMRPRGLVILAGTTGSGKSTSMAAMLDWRNEHAAGHIITIEDPVEHIHRPKKSIVTHREVGTDALSWRDAVQNAMRQAPDVVSMGEVRNLNGMEHALQLAQTGHLCFLTIHASNANQAIERILNFFPEDHHQQVLMDLAMNVVAIIGQRLVVKKGGKGRRVIVDLLINTPVMQDYIFKGKLMDLKAVMAKSEQDGMQTFDQNLFELYCQDVIDYDEALRQADSINDLRLRIKLYEEGRASGQIFERVDDLNLI